VKSQDIPSAEVAIIGLGYVGLPLFALFSKRYKCVGVDVDQQKIEHINKEYAYVSKSNNNSCKVTSDWNEIKDADIYIITVPTPINDNNEPDLTPLTQACEGIGKCLSMGNIVVLESTVYPGATEELCSPILEKESGLKCNIDFFIAYSPERVNVGDKEHSINRVPKIVAGSTSYTTSIISRLYQSVIDTDVVIASSIKVAEAAKMYENVQRDVMIALANEYSEFCRSEQIDIFEVTRCASSKWNFMNVSPGLVGGHCISVDPYYLLNRAKEKHQTLPLVKTAREINEIKPLIVAKRICELANEVDSERLSILLLGFSYKPNTSDFRNTKVADVIRYLNDNKIDVDCFDPLVDEDKVMSQFGIHVINDKKQLAKSYGLIVKMVNHDLFEGFSLGNASIIEISDLL
jgi:UDP-N-acetyl-D-glucosamine/UDP-N-acetyl-D-galactosamine dehydrogenase